MLLLSSDKDAVPALYVFFAVPLPSSSSDLANVSTELVWLIEVERHGTLGSEQKLLSAGMRLVSEEALVSAWLSLAEGHLYVAHGSGIIVAWWCEPPAPMLSASMCPASSSKPGG